MSVNRLNQMFEARRSAQDALQGLYEEHGITDLSEEVRAEETKISDEISDLQGREGALIASMNADKVADEARAASPIPDNVGVPAVAPSLGSALQSLVTGERSSVEVGYEARDAVNLTAGTATDGAELVESALLAEIHDLMVVSSPILQSGVKVLRTSGGADLILPRVTSHSAASLVAEAGAFGDDSPQFDTVTLGSYKLGFMVPISRELEQDSAFNVARFVTESGAAALGRGADAYFAAGTGVNQPSGVVLADTGMTTAAVAAVTMDELIEAQHSVANLGQRAKAAWILNDESVEAIRKLKDANSDYLWRPGAQAGAPDTLLGNPIFSDPNVAVQGAGNTFGVFGDMSGFAIRIAGGVQIDRSEHVGFANDLVTYRFLVRVDSKIVDTTGIRALVNAAV